MNKLIRSSLIGLGLGLATTSCVTAEREKQIESFELQHYVDPEIQYNGIGKIICKIANREQFYDPVFESRREAEKKLQEITGVANATLSTTLSIGAECQQPVPVANMRQGVGVVVEGSVKDDTYNTQKIHEVCLVTGFPLAKDAVTEATKLNVFCPSQQVGHF